MSPTAHSAKLKLIYGSKMSKTAALDTLNILFVHACIACMDGGYSQGGGGASDPSCPPLNEILQE